MGDIYTGVEELVGESVARHVAAGGDAGTPALALAATLMMQVMCLHLLRRARSHVPALYSYVSRIRNYISIA